MWFVDIGRSLLPLAVVSCHHSKVCLIFFVHYYPVHDPRLSNQTVTVVGEGDSGGGVGEIMMKCRKYSGGSH